MNLYSPDTEGTDLDPTLIRPIRAYSMSGLEAMVCKNMESLLTEEELHDVVFVVGPEHEKQQVFYGIRALFAIHSPVLRRMLYGSSFMESQLETKIFINDVTVESFAFIQQFFYGLNPILNESIIVDILYVSKKYLITSLEHGCIDYISSITDIEAVLNILSRLYNLSLIDVCCSILSQHQALQNQSDQIWNSQRLVSLPKEIIIKLLQLSCADMKEEVIWESCIEWSKHQALKCRNAGNTDALESEPWPLPTTPIPYSKSLNNLCDLNINEQYQRMVSDEEEWKKYITDLLPFIRFPLMDSKYFVHNISKLGVLTDQQIIGVMTYYLDNTESGNLSFSHLRRINEFSFNIYCPKYGFVSDSGRTIKVTNNRKKCLFSSSTTWNYGIHKWKYQIFECYVIAVGIITDYKICNEPDRTLLDSSLSYFNSCGGDCCIVEEQKLDDLAKVEQWGEGDTIEIELNCNDWTLKFGKNGTQMGKIISIKKNQLYHPVLASVGKNKVNVSFY